MKKILTKEMRTFKLFWAENKLLFVFIGLVTVLTYSSKLFFYSYSIDTEHFIREPQATLQWWLEINRYGLVFLKKLLMFGMDTNVSYINFLTYLLLASSAIFLAYFIWRLNYLRDGEKRNGYLYLGTLLYLTSPVMIEQTNFILQSVEVVLSFIFLFLALLAIQVSLEEKFYWGYLIGLLFTVAALSIYPSLQVAFIVVTIMLVIFQQKQETASVIQYIKNAVPFAVVFLLGYVLNNLLAAFLLKWLHLKQSSYVLGASIIGKLPMNELLKTIWGNYLRYFWHQNSFFTSLVTILAVLVIVSTLVTKKSIQMKICLLLSVFASYGIMLTPLFVLGWMGPVRSLAPTIPLLLFFYTCLLMKLIRHSQVLVICAGLFILLMGIGQSKVTADFGMTEYEVYQQELQIADELRLVLQDEYHIQNFSEYRLAVIGNRVLNKEYLKTGDLIGQSFFEFGAGGPLGPTIRTSEFFYIQGIKVAPLVDVQAYRKIVESNQDMQSFPQKNSVRVIGKTIILRF